MKPFFTIELLPAKNGDSIWIEYGKSDRTRRILIDGGPINAYEALEEKLNEMPAGDKRVELVVISHVDTDHIEGIIRHFAEKRSNWNISPRDIWFNGYRHMQKKGMLGGREGDFLSALIRQRESDKWNKEFNNKAVVVQPDKPLPSDYLVEEMKYTILSPDVKKLERMAKKWEKDVDKHGLRPGDLEGAWEQLLNKTRLHPKEGLLGAAGEIDPMLLKQLSTDQSAANGSSIAFLLEFQGKSCLFLADAHASTIAQSLKRLLPKGKKRLKVDAVKVSHHGSKANITKKLMDLLDARHYLISTNGDRHDHPDPEAIEVIIQGSLRDPVIWFNYRTPYTLPWEPENHRDLRKYSVRYPELGSEGITIDMFSLES
jgi:beta-lactamase superfamily II metal-dependent hydrolase